ncbi:HAMP domain-containing histidine kinase [Candidatus Nomurabacteria bacterium]|nr:HAMP domain-containing histidine kinase [Candidatus Nomurabacteria bacterium]
MFHKTSVRLAGLYLVIIMVISFLFSATLYNLSARELDRGFARQGSFIDNYPGDEMMLPPKFQRQFIKNRAEVIKDSKEHLLGNLVVANLFIFLISGFLSYVLARSSLKPIEESHKALEQFTADASHELRTPLAAMKTEIEVLMMQKKITDKEARNVLVSNLEEIDSITNLTHGLLSLARLEEQPITIKAYPVEQLLKNTVKKLEPIAKVKGINIAITTNNNQAKIKVDKSTFIESLVILLDNAIKFSKEGGQVLVESRLSKDKVVISIKDFGQGIDKSDLPHVFDRFYQSQGHRNKSRDKGHGLGLSIAKQLLQKQNCTTSIKSKKGEYTLAEVTAPVSR